MNKEKALTVRFSAFCKILKQPAKEEKFISRNRQVAREKFVVMERVLEAGRHSVASCIYVQTIQKVAQQVFDYQAEIFELIAYIYVLAVIL